MAQLCNYLLIPSFAQLQACITLRFGNSCRLDDPLSANGAVIPYLHGEISSSVAQSLLVAFQPSRRWLENRERAAQGANCPSFSDQWGSTHGLRLTGAPKEVLCLFHRWGHRPCCNGCRIISHLLDLPVAPSPLARPAVLSPPVTWPPFHNRQWN